MSKRVPSDDSAMRLAFKRHYEAAQMLAEHRRSRLLLLFYAAEVGLKAVCMRDIPVVNSDDLIQHLKDNFGIKDGHDLMKLIAAANIPATDVAGAPNSFSVDDAGTQRLFSESKIHEATRYGAKVCPNYLSQMEQWLSTVCQVVKQRLGGAI